MAVFQLSSFCSKIPEDLLQAVFERFEIYDANFKLLRTEKWEEQWKEITKGCEPETVARLLALLQQTNDFRIISGNHYFFSRNFFLCYKHLVKGGAVTVEVFIKFT